MVVQKLRVVIVLICLVCIALSLEGSGSAERPHTDVARLEKKIHALVNRERQKHGLSALSLDADLRLIARRHSQDMALRDYFSHDDPEGRDFSDRYRAAGFRCRVPTGNAFCTGAENICQFHQETSSVPEDDTAADEIAESVVRGWMNSANHRKNILTPYFGRQGIGVALSADGTVYVTENFC